MSIPADRAGSLEAKGAARVVRQWFKVMNDMLDEMLVRYPAADAAQRGLIEAQLRKLQIMSDTIVDGWLQMEEKLARLREMAASRETAASGDAKEYKQSLAAAAAVHEETDLAAQGAAMETAAGQASGAAQPSLDSAQAGTSTEAREEAQRHLTAGQGYYDLAMYKDAAASFNRAVELCPEMLAARMFLAMSHMHLREWENAERQFLFIVRRAAQPKLKALGLNALGCIQAVTANLEQAIQYFRQACELDPAFTGAARNLANCKANAGPLTLYFGGSGFGCT
jgi:tetratricopeptide (TPR) repeat protein